MSNQVRTLADQFGSTRSGDALPPDALVWSPRLPFHSLAERPTRRTNGLDALRPDTGQHVVEIYAARARGGLPKWRLQRVVHHVEANISGRLSVAELALVAQMSASHFSRTFKETVGLSPHGYVTRQRIAAAQALIATSEHPLAEIAVMCGTADQAHLNRLFTKFCGVTPGIWRRDLQWSQAGVREREGRVSCDRAGIPPA